MNYYDKNIIEIHNDLINKKVTSKELIDFSKNKILETNKKFNAYNYRTGSSTTSDTNNYSDYFGGKISNTFMCAYFVSK